MASPELAAEPTSAAEPIYTRRFWLAYAANFALVTANAVTFRFAELVAYLGGTEKDAGVIVGTGLLCVLVVRLYLGQAIDRYGTRLNWLLTSLLFIFGCGLSLFCTHLGVALYFARICFAIGLAGMLTCSVVHVQNLAPTSRRTEAIGTLGTSGFLGTIAGTNLGDLIFAHSSGFTRFEYLFGAATVLGILYLITVTALTRRDVHERPPYSPPAHRLLMHYWPGPVAIVAVTLGMGLSLTTVFLTRFATANHLPGIRTFFTAYSLFALIFRVKSTTWARTIGRHKLILIGLAGNIAGHLLLPLVSREWHFILPAMACGFGHACLYPAVVSLGAGAFPRLYRGMGTTLVLGFTEVGAAGGPPILGWIIDHYNFTPMFISAAVFGIVVAAYYAIVTAGQPDNDTDLEPELLLAEKTQPPDPSIVP